MKTTKKVMMLNINHYDEIENRLEQYAKEGLILKKTGTIFWTFTKSEPQNLKYTVTYFKEGSVFNPEYTDNQLTYFEYAKASGWELVCEFGQMQIFCNSQENPVPFETDDMEKLENIHKCMKKSFIPSQVLLLVVWILNLGVRIPSLISRPIDFLSDKVNLVSMLMFTSVVIFSAYTIISYYNWYNNSKKSILMGGEIKKSYSKTKSFFEKIYLVGLFAVLVYQFAIVFNDVNAWVIVLMALQVPFYIFVFSGMIKLLKKLKVSAITNRIITFVVYIFVAISFTAFVFYIVVNFDLTKPDEQRYNIIEWNLPNGDVYDYRIYSDEIPLTCEDLYGETDFEYYSYLKQVDKTIFLTKEKYSQQAPPVKEDIPEINYEIYTSKYNWVQKVVLNELITDKEKFDYHAEIMDNNIFGTNEAYTFYDTNDAKKSYISEYILVYEDKIIKINPTKQFNENESDMVIEKLR